MRDVNQLSKQFDVLVIGGGINGAAIAYLAAKAGLQVCLLEKDDFAQGTSSRSTKLLHGGIRYLENFEFDLVTEALKERYIQWQAAPHLVKPMPFVIPVYKGDKRPLWMMQLGVWLYDRLSGKYRIGQHRTLSVDEVVGMVPGINRQGLIGAVEYYDAQMDDARITIENVLMAKHHGAVVFNHMKVVELIKDNGKVSGVKAHDQISGSTVTVKASTVIATVGPWADEMRAIDIAHQMPRLRTTKGVHLVYQGQIAPNAFLIQSKQDNRIFFVIPFDGNTLIGTTDTDYKDSPDNVRCEESDVQYLLAEAARVFPHIRFDQSRIVSTFAGVRPLVLDTNKKNASAVSRKHVIEQASSGLWYVLGGKYTTYRAIAYETLHQVFPEQQKMIVDDGRHELFGSGAVNTELKLLRHRYGVSIETIRYLTATYGSRFEDVLKLTLDNPGLKQPLCTCSLAIKAQVIYSRDVEMAQTVDDVHDRRLGLNYKGCVDNCRQMIEALLIK